MRLVQIIDGNVSEVKSAEAWELFPIPCEPRHYLPYGFFEVKDFLPHDSATEKLTPHPIYLQEGFAYTVIVSPKDEADIEADKAIALQSIKAERNAKLTACDFTQLPDYPHDPAPWVKYRQALRDLPNNGTIKDPRTFTDWPTPPSK